MRYFNIILLCVMLVMTMLSCDTSFPNTQSTWVVSKIEYQREFMSTYFLITTDNTNLNVGSTWMMDSIDKFEVGDTVVFSKK